MSCYGSGLSKEEEKAYEVGECEGCGEPIDEDGKTCSSDNCSYSNEVCTCGYSPCDLSC